MIGCGHARIALTSSPVRRVNASSPLTSRESSGPMISWTSPPDEKFPPFDAKTTALTWSSAASARKVSRSSAYESNVSEFFHSGRRSEMTATRPSTRQLKCVGMLLNLCCH
jgi:hypothetical protein